MKTSQRPTRPYVLPIVAILSLLALPCSAATAMHALARTNQPLAQSTRKGPVQLAANLDRSMAQIAEPLTLTLTAEAPSGVGVTFPPQTATLGALNVVKVTDAFDIPAADGRQWIRRYQLDSLVAGKHTIPPISLAFHDRRGATPVSDVIQSPSLDVTITSVLEGQTDPLKFRDVKDVVELPVETKLSQAWLVWSLGGAALIACAGMALLVWPLGQRQPSARRWALGELDALETSELIAAEQTQLFYFRLTDILRQYLQRQFGIAAPRLTTAEFLDQATRDNTLDQSQQALLKVFLSLADLVKFARFEPGTDDARQAIARARQFIEHTARTSGTAVRRHEPAAPVRASIESSRPHRLPLESRQLTTTGTDVLPTSEEI